MKFAKSTVKPEPDPAIVGTGDAYMLKATIFSNLTQVIPGGTAAPQLAERWEANEDSSE